MARTKRVLFVSAAEFNRVKDRMKAENAKAKLAAEIYARALAVVSKDMYDLTHFLRDTLSEVRQLCAARSRLWQNRQLALVACGRPGCRNLMLRNAVHVTSALRRCNVCANEERALFQEAAAAIAASGMSLQTPPPPSPSSFLASEEDSAQTI